jgi:hypothetical protein
MKALILGGGLEIRLSEEGIHLKLKPILWYIVTTYSLVESPFWKSNS